MEAIEELRPAANLPADSPPWRTYQILSFRYVEALAVPTILKKLAISRSAFFRDHRRAIEAVAVLLRECRGPERDTSVPDGTRSIHAISPLPVPLTSFIGRDRELADLHGLFGSTRLLTLTGAGGCGKTRLALRFAAELVETYPDGVWLVDLAALTDPALVPGAVATAVGVRESIGQPIQSTLVSWLRSRQVLLVLDNCEHLVDACARLADAILRAGPGTRILATSRQALGVTGEIGWRVPSLATPSPEDFGRPSADSASTALAYPAVQLFVERAQAALPEFSLGIHNVDAIVQICWRLDGIPLAIELAATLVDGIGPAQIARRLDDCFHLLTFGDPSALPRHQTLRATLDWSYSLLSDDERTLFQRLAVFGGHFSLEAVEDVCGTDQLARIRVLTCLVRLVEKSLVVMLSVRDEARYRLLETMRQYARERLTSAGEADALASRHRDWYVQLVDQIGNGLWDENQAVWLNRLQDENDNLRIALAWFRDHDATTGLRLASQLWRFWSDRGYMREGEQWLTSLLDRSPERTILRARALYGLGYLQGLGRGLGSAESTLRESLSIFDEKGDLAGTGVTLGQLGKVAMHFNQDYQRAAEYFDQALTALRGAPDLSQAGDRSMTALACAEWAIMSMWEGKREQAQALFEEGFDVFRQVGDKRGMSYTLRHLGELQRCQGQCAQAGRNLEKALSLARETGIDFHLADSLVKSADLARSVGDYRRSKALIDECLALRREAGQNRGIPAALYSLGQLALAEGNDLEAETRFRESLAQDRLRKNQLEVPRALSALGALAVRAGSLDRGVRLVAAATTLHPLFPTILDPEDSVTCEIGLDHARVELGPERFAFVWREGQAMTLEEAVAFALSDEDVAAR